MSPTTNRMVAILGLASLAFAGVPAAASAGGATLYELTENMRLDNLARPTQRTASAALQGTAQIGTGICPTALIGLLQMFSLPTGASCTVTAFAESDVAIQTGTGAFIGGFAVVVNTDNAADAPEMVVMTGKFHADMQVEADASGKMLPLIRITDGTVAPTDVLGVPVAYVGSYFPGLTPEMFPAASFGGVFRLPFALDESGKKKKPGKAMDTFYLADDGGLIKIDKDELSLGYANVRVEIVF
ncbi:MAG: hypothetical protein DMD78_17175 [Candidatus Rokuibacteriota bacterium]|nr:MAG: hypothetical protein DMD78_17175 [Candidatus Rokubacteria bacterium]